MKRSEAEVIAEYGPFGGDVGGVTFDGHEVWFAAAGKLHALDPDDGGSERTVDVAAEAGTAFDGTYLYQIVGDQIHKIDPTSGATAATIPAPSRGDNSGLSWAEGTLWVGQYEGRRIHQLDPETGAVLRTIESNRFVTGVTWNRGDLWHATWENEESELRRLDSRSGEVLDSLSMPDDMLISGLESDGGDRFFCGGGGSGMVRIVRRPGSPTR